MPIDLKVLCKNLQPTNTILLFGAGSTEPSGGPSGSELAELLCQHFKLDFDASLSLADVSTIIEKTHGRRELIQVVKERIQKLQPTGGIVNLPLYDWAGIYTTNYDTIIEKAFKRRDQELNVYASNFDFDAGGASSIPSLYKLHGTIDQDISLGHNSKVIITGSDYDDTSQFREVLFGRFSEQLLSKSALIIGHSLADPDLKTLIDEALRVKSKYGAPGKITLFAYEPNKNHALIFESRGFEVCFGGLDEFFNELAKNSAPTQLVLSVTSDPLDCAPEVYPSTLEISKVKGTEFSNLAKMFNGAPATYGDVSRSWTFERDISRQLETQLAEDNNRIAFLLGSAGVGKTTSVRQVLSNLVDREIRCFEHASDFELPYEGWIRIDHELRKLKQNAVLFVDNAHEHMRAINRLTEAICSNDKPALKLILTSSKALWNPRNKAASIFSHGTEYIMSSLSDVEIERLLDLLETKPSIAELVEPRFLGFSRVERRNRLSERCSADMFVCLKNIFGFQSIDNIILEEFACLSSDYQDIYSQVAAMEAAGVRVHRQLVMRIVGIQAINISRLLEDLDGIIEEYSVSERDGIFRWCVRHPLIARLISKYKFSEQEDIYSFLDRIIENLNPTYKIEVQSVNDICDFKTGIGRLHDKRQQNVLLRKMISSAPYQRVPRHRLITNLIDIGEFELAEGEIRIFEKLLRPDGPVNRYKVLLKLAIAKNSPKITDKDRASIVSDAATLAQAAIKRFPDDKNIFRAYLEVGIAHYKYARSTETFDNAMAEAQKAQERILDPDLRRTISTFDRMREMYFP